MEKILIIEDEERIQRILRNYLVDAGYKVVTADDGLEGFTKFKREDFSLVLLDIMMPKIDGFATLELIRSESDVPVMMLTAMGEDVSQLKAFDLEADDYIVKPFSLDVVLRRVKAILRRNQKMEGPVKKILSFRDLQLDLESCQVFVKEDPITLTVKEFDLLKLFLKNQNRVFTREDLLELLWGYEFYGNPKLVNVHIKNLRQKLSGDYIETVRGMGYRLTKGE